jgi:hypothetical protein
MSKREPGPTNKFLTVKRIKQILSNYPDKALVRFHTSWTKNLTLLSVYTDDVKKVHHIEVDIGDDGE